MVHPENESSKFEGIMTPTPSQLSKVSAGMSVLGAIVQAIGFILMYGVPLPAILNVALPVVAAGQVALLLGMVMAKASILRTVLSGMLAAAGATLVGVMVSFSMAEIGTSAAIIAMAGSIGAGGGAAYFSRRYFPLPF